jgi:hypothetical protein
MKSWWKKTLAAAICWGGTSVAMAETPASPPAGHAVVNEMFTPWTAPVPEGSQLLTESMRRPFESDRAFDNFIGPVSNPINSKDPRALTEARLLFVQNHIPTGHPLGGGDFQVYAMQVRVALTERLSFIADKDGHAVIKTPGTGKRTGWLNLAAGFKYSLIRDVESQTLLTAGFMFEPQTGEADAFSSHGDGLFTVFGVFGKEFGNCNHVLFNAGYQFPVDSASNSSYFFTQLHFDRQMFGWLYPLVELNWIHWVEGGNRGLPPALGEGDGLLNLGTTGVAGNDFVTVAAGLKAKVCRNLDAGIAYEVPISNRKDLMSNRILAELIIRY